MKIITFFILLFSDVTQSRSVEFSDTPKAIYVVFRNIKRLKTIRKYFNYDIENVYEVLLLAISRGIKVLFEKLEFIC